MGPPDTTLPLLLPPFSLISQWSEVDELVEPAKRQKGREWYLHISFFKQATCSDVQEEKGAYCKREETIQHTHCTMKSM